MSSTCFKQNWRQRKGIKLYRLLAEHCGSAVKTTSFLHSMILLVWSSDSRLQLSPPDLPLSMYLDNGVATWDIPYSYTGAPETPRYPPGNVDWTSVVPWTRAPIVDKMTPWVDWPEKPNSRCRLMLTVSSSGLEKDVSVPFFLLGCLYSFLKNEE